MNSISWTDLNPAEQRAIAVLAAGISIELCDTAALLYETRRARQGLLFDTKSRKIVEIRRSAGAGGLNGRCPAPGHPCWDDRYWRQSGRGGLSPIRRMGDYGTTDRSWRKADTR